MYTRGDGCFNVGYWLGISGFSEERSVSSGIDGISKIRAAATAYGDAQSAVVRRTPPPAESASVDRVAIGDVERGGTEPAAAVTRTASFLRDMFGEDDVAQVVSDTNARMELQNRSIRFRINEDTDDIQIQIVDSERDRVIRSIPSDEMIALANRMRELSGIGAMVDQSR